MTSETKTFNGLTGSYILSYGYNLADQVTSVTDQHSGTSFTNVYDATGRVNSVSGVGYVGATTQFAPQISYRAFGAPKSFTYGNNTSISFGYDARLSLTSFRANFTNAGYYFGAAYQYYADGSLKLSQDQSTYVTPTKDRAYSYDHAGRLAEAYSGSEARDFINNTNSGVVDGPYRQSYARDAWDNVTNENWRFWSRSGSTPSSYNTSNRNTTWSYDNQGNLLSRNDGAQNGYDARNLGTSQSQTDTVIDYVNGGSITNIFNNTFAYDADGQLVHYVKTHDQTINASSTVSSTNEVYSLRSTVLGGRVISEYTGQGVWIRSYVYAGNARLGEQSRFGSTATSSWRYLDPLTGDEGGTVLDPQGVDVGLSDPFPPNAVADPDGLVNGADPVKNGSASLLAVESGGAKCVLDGMEMDCSFIRGEVSVQCPDNDCGPRRDKNGHLTEPFRAFVDGHAGFLPRGAKYLGNGEYLAPPDDDNLDGSTGSLAQIQRSAGNLSSSKVRYTARQIDAAIDDCTQRYFEVALKAFLPSSAGQNGRFLGEDLSGVPDPDDKEITVWNDVKTFNWQQLTALYVKGGGYLRPHEVVIGLTINRPNVRNGPSFSPNRNYTANNRNSATIIPGVDGWKETQIWELGNSLNEIVGARSKLANAPEAGPIFTDCVKKNLERWAYLN